MHIARIKPFIDRHLTETGPGADGVPPFSSRRTLDEGIQELLKGYRTLGRAPLRNV